MDTQNLGANAGQWFEMGQRAGGRTAGVGSALKVLVDTLKEDKAIKAELEGQKTLIDYKAKAEKENRSPLEDVVERGKIATAAKAAYDAGLDPNTALGIDVSSVLGGKETTTPSQIITTPSLGSGEVKAPAKDIMEGYEEVPIGVTETPFGSKRIETKIQPTLKKQLADEAAKLEMQTEIKSKVPTVQQKNDLDKVNQQISNIKDMRSLAEKIGTYPGSRIAQGTAAAISGGGWATEHYQYLMQRPAMAVSLYRALTGDTRLSDADAEARALPLLWKPGQSSKIRKSSFDYIENALNTRKQMIEQGRYSLSPDGDYITPFENVIAETKGKGVSLKGQQTQGQYKVGDTITKNGITYTFNGKDWDY